MSATTIIIFGISFAILLIFSCIVLQAPRLYSEVELARSSILVQTHTPFNETLVLRDRR